MPIRVTPMQAIERNGLKGWGMSIFIDRKDGANEQPETATKQRANVPPQHEIGATIRGPADQATVQNSGVTRPGEQRPLHSEQTRASSRATAADPVGTPPITWIGRPIPQQEGQ